MYAGDGKKYLDKAYQSGKKMSFIRTPPDLWKTLNDEFNFTLDTCSSEKNHLCKKYYTEETNGLAHSWEGEIVYCHPLYDRYIPKWVKKCSEEKCISVMLLPASTHTKYFHQYCYNKKNCEIRFLPNIHKEGKSGYYMADDDGNIHKGNSGYIRPLMILIFRNVNER